MEKLPLSPAEQAKQEQQERVRTMEVKRLRSGETKTVEQEPSKLPDDVQ